MAIPVVKRPLLYYELIYGAPVLAYAGLIFLLSAVSKFPDLVPTFSGFDKLAHFAEYYLLGGLIYRWLDAERFLFRCRHAVFLTILIGTLYGISDEWHQSFVPGRDASPWDALIDGLAVATAAATFDRIMRKFPLLKALS